ncbi:fasciclin domain-containing protein [Epidermidibacterium keratini]|nr:fasciclin domain-containing protein [Epidermidibacterium keratini]
MRHRTRAAMIATALTLSLSACGGVQERASTPSATTTTTPPPAASGPQCASLGGDALPELSDKTLSEAAAAMPGTVTYSGFLQANADRAEQLDKARGVSVFIPADPAFTAMDADTAAKLADPAWGLALLEYSVVTQTVLPDALNTTAAELPTVRSQDAQITTAPVNGAPLLNGAAGVLCASIAFDGGVIYLTDKVLLPPG